MRALRFTDEQRGHAAYLRMIAAPTVALRRPLVRFQRRAASRTGQQPKRPSRRCHEPD